MILSSRWIRISGIRTTDKSYSSVLFPESYKKLSCRWQTARRISANAMTWLI